MSTQIDDLVLENFRISEDDLRDLDSIAHRHCEIVKYYVHRGSVLGGYDTDDVEDLLRERNGIETRIVSVRLHATGLDALKFNVDFDKQVKINGECEDRSRLVLLTTEARAVIQDRMTGRTPNRKTILQAVAVICFVLGYLGFQQFQNNYVNRLQAEQSAQSQRLTAPYQRALQAAIPSDRKLLSEGLSVLSGRNLNAQVGFLLQQQIDQLRQQVVGSEEAQVTNSDYSAPSWWTGSYWLVIAVASIFSALVVGIGYLTIPSDKSVFLIGDEKRRQERADKRREHIIWGIGVTFVIGIASGVLSSLR